MWYFRINVKIEEKGKEKIPHFVPIIYEMIHFGDFEYTVNFWYFC